jgi:hypothetical protein
VAKVEGLVRENQGAERLLPGRNVGAPDAQRTLTPDRAEHRVVVANVGVCPAKRRRPVLISLRARRAAHLPHSQGVDVRDLVQLARNLVRGGARYERERQDERDENRPAQGIEAPENAHAATIKPRRKRQLNDTDTSSKRTRARSYRRTSAVPLTHDRAFGSRVSRPRAA